jgi:hypothetical protein
MASAELAVAAGTLAKASLERWAAFDFALSRSHHSGTIKITSKITNTAIMRGDK